MFNKNQCKITPLKGMNERSIKKLYKDTTFYGRLPCSYFLKALIYINFYKTFFVGIKDN